MVAAILPIAACRWLPGRQPVLHRSVFAQKSRRGIRGGCKDAV